MPLGSLILSENRLWWWVLDCWGWCMLWGWGWNRVPEGEEMGMKGRDMCGEICDWTYLRPGSNESKMGGASDLGAKNLVCWKVWAAVKFLSYLWFIATIGVFPINHSAFPSLDDTSSAGRRRKPPSHQHHPPQNKKQKTPKSLEEKR